MRAFFSVALPDDLVEPLADVQSALEGADGLRFVEPAQAHVTLKFLGDVDEGGADASPADASPADADAEPTVQDVIAAGERAVERAGVEPFECHVTGLGVFPSLEYVSVVWAGIGAGGTELTRLHEALEAETTAVGVEPEAHEFTPHVTLARMNDARGKELVQEVVRDREPEIGRFTVEEIRLTESTLTADGPVYETVETFLV